MDLQLDNVEKKNEKTEPKRNVYPPIWKPTAQQHGTKMEKKLPNHILFKLEFMMFITNDVDPWWMQMRNERAKIVPSHCRSEYQIECSASAVLHSRYTGVMDPSGISPIRSKYYRFHVCFYYIIFIQKPIFPLINSMSSIVCDNHKPNTLNSCDSLKFLEITEKKSLCIHSEIIPIYLVGRC